MKAAAILILFCTLLFGCTQTAVQAPEASKPVVLLTPIEAMRGGKNFDIFVNLPNDLDKKVAQQYELDADAIRTAAELRCRSLGLPVLAQGGSTNNHLVITVNALSIPNQLVYSIQVDFMQAVKISGAEDNQVAGASTWSADYMGLLGENRAAGLRKVIGETVDKFVNDYLTANPKK